MVIAEGVTSATHYNTTARQGGWEISLHEKRNPAEAGSLLLRVLGLELVRKLRLVDGCRQSEVAMVMHRTRSMIVTSTTTPIKKRGSFQ